MEEEESYSRAEEAPRTVERKIVTPVRSRRKLRKMNDGGKLKVVHNGFHNSSDYNLLMLRPMGQKESTENKSRRLKNKRYT